MSVRGGGDERRPPGGVVFEGQKFTRKPGEPLELLVHHFLDMHRDFLQIALGKLIEDLASLLVGAVNIGPISLSRLIGASGALKLSDEIYSLPIGCHSVALQPLALAADGSEVAFATTALEEVFAFGPIGPSGPPPRIEVVGADAKTARMTLVFNRA